MKDPMPPLPNLVVKRRQGGTGSFSSDINDVYAKWLSSSVQLENIMAVIPGFESALIEVRQSLGFERHQSRKQDKFINLEMPLDNYLAMIREELDAIFEALEMDAAARRVASFNIMNWANFQQALTQRIWTLNASQRQVIWHLAVFSYAPALGRLLGNWNLEQSFDKGMPGGDFWFLPKADEKTGKVTLPVQHVLEWLMDLIGLPMDEAKLHLGGERAKRTGAHDSMEKSLYNWLSGTLPSIQSIELYFPDDIQMRFEGSFELAANSTDEDKFAAALAFVARKQLDAEALRLQIPMTQSGRLESILSGEASAEEMREFVRMLAARYKKPEMRTVRQRLRVARMVQEGYGRLVKFLCPGLEKTCSDPYRNKVLQLLAIVRTVYNLTVGAYKIGKTQAEEDAWFERQVPPWDKETIFLSILPSRFKTAYVEVAELLTRQFAKLEAEGPLVDFVPMDEANAPRIVESKFRLLKEMSDECGRTEHLLDRIRRSSPWRALQAESDYWTVSQVAQSHKLPAKALRLVIQRMRELATTPSQAIGPILLELHSLLNCERGEMPKDVERRVEELLAEADASSGRAEWEAALLQYQAKHCLGRNDFDAATELFRRALEASAERNCSSMRGEIARDLLAVSVANRRLVPGEHEKPYRHMLANGMIEGADVSLENTARESAAYFWDTLYKPYPGHAAVTPIAAKQAKKIVGETFAMIHRADWNGLRDWLKANAPHFRKERIREVRGDSVLLLWQKMCNTLEERMPQLQASTSEEMQGGVKQMKAHLANWRQAICILIDAWPEQANLPDFKSQTPLMLAAERGDAALVRTLLAAGADVNAQDYRGRTCLHAAVLGASPECVATILERHPDLTKATVEEGNSSLHTAIKLGNPEIVGILVERAPELAVQANFAGYTPYSYGEKFLQNLPAVQREMKRHGRRVGLERDYRECLARLRLQ